MQPTIFSRAREHLLVGDLVSAPMTHEVGFSMLLPLEVSQGTGIPRLMTFQFNVTRPTAVMAGHKITFDFLTIFTSPRAPPLTTEVLHGSASSVREPSDRSKLRRDQMTAPSA